MIYFVFLAGIVTGIAFSDFLYLKLSYWQDLERFLNQRDEIIIKKLTKKQPQDHYEKSLA